MSFGFGFGFPSWRTLAGGFSPAALFVGGVQGAWYDPSDLSTMFTTSAGTTPVAMPGQGAAVPVGLMLDKSQGLVLGANVLGSVWSTIGSAIASGSSVTFNSVSDIAAFQSVMTAGVRYLVSFDYNITSGQAGLYVGTNGGTGAAIIDLSGLSGTGSFSGYFIAGSALFIFRDNTGCVASFTNITLKAQLGNHAISFNNTTARPELRARVNLLVATATLSTQNVTTQATSYTLSFAGTGSITLSGTATGSYSAGTHTITCTAGTLTLTVSGTVTTADLRPANSGALLPAYQAVVDANTYDTNGFPLYLRFDGIDDSMYTPANLNLSGTDKVAVFAGVRKLSDAALAVVAEISANSGVTNGTFAFFAPLSAAANYGFRAHGTGLATYAGTTYTAPITNVTSCVHDIAGATIAEEIIPRVNGVTPTLTATNAGPAGTGNFGTYPLYIGSRNNASTWFNGHLYSLAVVGSAVSGGNIAAMESWVAGKTGIQI